MTRQLDWHGKEERGCEKDLGKPKGRQRGTRTLELERGGVSPLESVKWESRMFRRQKEGGNKKPYQ